MQEVLEQELNLLDYLGYKKIDPATVVIEYNLNIIRQEEWSSIIIKENDNLEILRFVGGG